MAQQDKIYFTIPGMWERWPLVIALLILKKQYPQYFYNNIEIESVYGNFNPCIWDGGRPQIDDLYMSFTTQEDIYNLLYIYNDLFNIPIRLLFTNSILKEEHLYDEFCNQILDIFNNGKNYIVINSSLLEKYIQNKYTNYKFISSITKVLNKQEFINELKYPQYILACMPTIYNKDTAYLEKIPSFLQQKIEILVNSYCFSSCPNKKKHYELNSMSNLKQIEIPNKQFKCPIYLKEKTSQEDTTLDIENINKYSKLFNIAHYKIQCRLLESYETWIYYIIYYLILPEYKEIALYQFKHIFYNMILKNNKNLNIIKNQI